MDFVDYVKLLRRRWQIPFACLVIGAVLGWVTTPAVDAEEQVDGDYFKATHVLNFNTPLGAGGAPLVTLSDLAFRVQVGDVPDLVARELGMSEQEVREQVRGVALPDVNALAVVAISEDAGDAVQLADITATTLSGLTNSSVVELYNTQLSELTDQQNELQAQITDIENTIENDTEQPGDVDELATLQTRLRLLDDQYAQVVAQGQPGTVINSVETATPQPITPNEYEQRLEQNQTIQGTESTTNTTAAPSTISDPGGAVGARTRALAGGVAGLILGIAIVITLDRFDSRLRTKREIEEVFGLPVIAEVPPLSRAQRKRAEIMVRTSPRSRLAEAYRAVRTSVLFVAASGAQVGVGRDGSARVLDRDYASGPLPWLLKERGEALTVMVSSPGPEEGKTSTTANLSALLAEAGMRVLVVNCDYRRPRIHRYFEGREVSTPSVEPTPDEQFDIIKGARIIDTAVPNVRLITGIGENDPDANPAQVIAAQRKVVEVARRHFDVIVLDTAPLLTTNDAVEVLSEADLVVLTARYGKTRREQAELAAELLERLSAPVVGIVFVESPDAPQAQYYYYYLDPQGNRRERRRDSADAEESIVRPLRPGGDDGEERRDAAQS